MHGAENMPGEVLISYAEVFCRIVDTAEWYLYRLFAGCFSHHVFRLTDRQAIKECLKPYVHKIPVLPTSEVCTEQEAKFMYEIPHEVILNSENFDKGYHAQSVWNGESTLLEFLRQDNN